MCVLVDLFFEVSDQKIAQKEPLLSGSHFIQTHKTTYIIPFHLDECLKTDTNSKHLKSSRFEELIFFNIYRGITEFSSVLPPQLF